MCVTRSELVNFWNFQSYKRSKKLIIESSQNIFFMVFLETNVVLFTYCQRYFNGQSLRENFFLMQNSLDFLDLAEITT